jgi:hypothetical protein
MNKRHLLGMVMGACLLISDSAMAEFSQASTPAEQDFSIGLVDEKGSVQDSTRRRIDAGPVAEVDPGLVMGSGIDFGDDLSEWANDGECDDPRFVGAGMTLMPLLDEDRLHDASDCLGAFQTGEIALADGNPLRVLGVDFGDNSSSWAYDGECDDPRFHGVGMVHAVPVDSDLYRDAADCSLLYVDGFVALIDSWDEPVYEAAPELVAVASLDGINFGDDLSQWAHDGECDDPRFDGVGMTPTILLDADTYHDASDCSQQYAMGHVVLAVTADSDFDPYANDYDNEITVTNSGYGATSAGGAVTDYGNGNSSGKSNGNSTGSGSVSMDASTVVASVNFGDDRSQWSFDYECDDPRFSGPGMTSTALLNQDMYHDATDCHRAYVAGDIWLR